VAMCRREWVGRKRGAQDVAAPILKGPMAGRERMGAWSGAPHGGQWKGELVQQRRRETGTGPGTASARGAAMPCG
jgi:hypothetical protein